MKKIVCIALLSFSCMSFAEEGEADAVVTEDSPAEEGMTIAESDKSFISDGSRVFVAREGISLIPPEGWEVKTDAPGLTALFQMPKKAGERLPRTIQIHSFAEPMYIDELSADEFSKKLEEKFSSSNSAITDYRLRSHIPVELDSGNKAWLFYFGFSLNGVDLMHAHLLASSANKHYVVTYTDIGENFVSESDGTDYLGIAWSTMTSLELPSIGPSRLGYTKYVSIGFALLAMIGLVYAIVRRKSAGKVYNEYADGKITTSFGTTISETRLEGSDDEVEVIVHTEMGDDDQAESDGLNFEDGEDSVTSRIS
ncbi:hypothetical protein N9D31_01895 [Oligoflexaceae bacterium]|nr:hypothetical protein [Oligoflexaceae bacterium]